MAEPKQPSKGPEDIFSGVEQPTPAKPAASPPRKAPQSIPRPQQPMIGQSETPNQRKRMFVIAVIAGVIVVGVTVAIIVTRALSTGNEKNATVNVTPPETATNGNTTEATNAETVNEETVEPIVLPESAIVDSDADGLSDDEERQLGTDATSPDTDNDGLFDREEVRFYKTDPLDSDTDNDGFTDGDEVRQGFNPKGEGDLLNINAAIESIGSE